ncbi:hypothetical protein A0H81_02825 [Grifola frondosa]|uniref:Uncharacterized protein n=1 Tax=Grifola frondosa TaxID=5627 RepID=A0A1C7MKM6_GRIFR|nr:hypothetical protein A0H81_02825 [Grifola frondosa]
MEIAEEIRDVDENRKPIHKHLVDELKDTISGGPAKHAKLAKESHPKYIFKKEIHQKMRKPQGRKREHESRKVAYIN